MIVVPQSPGPLLQILPILIFCRVRSQRTLYQKFRSLNGYHIYMRYLLRHADSFAAVSWSNSGQRIALTQKTLRSTLPSRPWNRASLTLPLFFSFSFLLFSFLLSHLYRARHQKGGSSGSSGDMPLNVNGHGHNTLAREAVNKFSSPRKLKIEVRPHGLRGPNRALSKNYNIYIRDISIHPIVYFILASTRLCHVIY